MDATWSNFSAWMAEWGSDLGIFEVRKLGGWLCTGLGQGRVGERPVVVASDGFGDADGLARAADKGSSRGSGPQVLDDVQQESRESGIRRIGVALHDLCQPLTTLQCRLEMAEVVGTPEAYREAVAAGLTECARLSIAVGSMRDMVRAASRELLDGQIGAGR